VSEEIVTTIDVAASRQEVWRLLVSFDEWPSWHPSIKRFEGSPTPGARLRFTARSPEGGGQVTLRPTLLVAEPARLLRWRGHFLVPGLFDATHEFTLRDWEAGTELTQRERFSGLLLPLMSRVVARTRRDNGRADLALKLRLEGR
jgi:hypothetical protein